MRLQQQSFHIPYNAKCRHIFSSGLPTKAIRTAFIIQHFWKAKYMETKNNDPVSLKVSILVYCNRQQEFLALDG